MKNILIAGAIATMATVAGPAITNAAPLVSDLTIANQGNLVQIHHKSRHHDRKFSNRGAAYLPVLPPRKIARILRHRGYHDITRISRHGRNYRVRAWGHRGPVKLVVSAYNGEILSRKRLYRDRYHRRYDDFSYGRKGRWSWSYRFH